MDDDGTPKTCTNSRHWHSGCSGSSRPNAVKLPPPIQHSAAASMRTGRRSFGDNVRHWRRERNWSQEDLADKLRSEGIDLHQTSVAKIERGTRPLRVAEAAAIATIFRVPPLAVFLGSPQTEARSPINQLNDMIASAQNLLNDMKADMSRSAGRYVEQEAHVLALARILNQTALDAEKHQSEQGTASGGGEDDAEA